MQFRALPWLQPKGLKLNNSLAAAHELILKRHGDQIPADQAMRDIAAAALRAGHRSGSARVSPILADPPWRAGHVPFEIILS
ncbi:hypothetical protein ACWEPL_23440 [Nonomuraea sp. NPDC004186]